MDSWSTSTKTWFGTGFAIAGFNMVAEWCAECGCCTKNEEDGSDVYIPFVHGRERIVFWVLE